MIRNIPDYNYDEIRRQFQDMVNAVNQFRTSGVLEAMHWMKESEGVVSQYLAIVDDATRSRDLFKAAISLHGLNQDFSYVQRTIDTLRDQDHGIHNSWMSEIRQMIPTSTELAEVAKIVSSVASMRTAYADTFLNTIDFKAMGQHFNVQQSLMTDLRLSLSNFTSSYRSLAESIPTVDTLFQLPSFVLPGASRELSTTSHALNALSPTKNLTETEAIEQESHLLLEEESESNRLISLLERVDPQLAKMFIGALASQNSDNPDRVRHVLVSLRELWNHLLRKLAPEKELREWITDHPDPLFLDSGKPTRRGKIRYVLRDLAHQPCVEFVEADTSAMIKLYGLYGRLHNKAVGVADKQLRAIILKTESYLYYILRAWEWSKE